MSVDDKTKRTMGEEEEVLMSDDKREQHRITQKLQLCLARSAGSSFLHSGTVTTVQSG